jgi:glycosyltransferase involved in cell wall biosynthesis
MKNILYINQYAGSDELGMEFRPFYLAKEWVKQGHLVYIIAASYSHTRVLNPKVVKDLDFNWINGIKYYWLKIPKYNKNNLLRLYGLFTFVIKLFYYRSFFSKQARPDIVIASSTYPLDVYPASLIAKLSNAKLVYEAPDLYPLTLITVVGLSRFNPFVVLLQYAEDFAYKKCDMVISVLCNAYEYMERHGLDKKRYAYVPNGVSVDGWKEKEELTFEISKLIKEIKEDNYFLVGYAGYHGILNCLTTLIDTANILREYKIKFLLVGQGPEREKLIKVSRELELKNIIFLDSLKKKMVPSFLAEMDVLFIAFNDSLIYRFGVGTNKLLDYLMSGRPIVQSQNAINDLVKECNCGISVPANNPAKVAEAILEVCNMSKKKRNDIGARGKIHVINNFNYENISKQYLKEVFADL